MIHSSTLPNGLRVLAIPMDSSATATLMVMVRGGSRFETREISGISHFMEHMFFKGGKKYPGTKEVSTAIDAVGGEFNAFTDYEEVAYYVKVASHHLPVALDVVSDMLLHATVPAEEVDRERNVIYEEINMYEDTPMQRIPVIAQRLMFGDHPLGWDIAGTKETLATIHRPQLLQFREDFYRPENMVVVIAGKVDPAAFLREVGETLPIQGAAGVAQPEAFAAHNPERFTLFTKKTEQAHLSINTPAPRLGAADEAAVKILTSVFGGGMSSRLFLSVRERQGLCYYIRASHAAYMDAGYIATTAGVTVDKIDDAIRSVVDEMRRLAEDGVTEEEFERGREYIKGHLAISLEDTANMAESVGSRAVRLGEVESLDAKLARYDRVTMEEVNAAARAYLDPSAAKLAVLGPYEDAEKFGNLLP